MPKASRVITISVLIIGVVTTFLGLPGDIAATRELLTKVSRVDWLRFVATEAFRTALLAFGLLSIVFVLLGPKLRSSLFRRPANQNVSVTHRQPSATIDALLSQVQGRTRPLSQCLAQGLAIAREVKNGELEAFCSSELTGWPEEPRSADSATYRVVKGFASPAQEINLDYAGWSGRSNRIFVYMRGRPEEYTEMKMFLPYAVSKLESDRPTDAEKGVFSLRTTWGKLLGVTKHSDHRVTVYLPGNTYKNVLDSIRTEFTRRLLTTPRN